VLGALVAGAALSAAPLTAAATATQKATATAGGEDGGSQLGVIVASKDVEVSDGDDGTHKADVIFTNLTSTSQALRVASAGSNCAVTLDGKDVTALTTGTPTKVALVFAKGCDFSEARTLTLEAAGTSVELRATKAAAPTTRWYVLWSFAIAFAASLALACILFWCWQPKRPEVRHIDPTDSDVSLDELVAYAEAEAAEAAETAGRLREAANADDASEVKRLAADRADADADVALGTAKAIAARVELVDAAEKRLAQAEGERDALADTATKAQVKAAAKKVATAKRAVTMAEKAARANAHGPFQGDHLDVGNTGSKIGLWAKLSEPLPSLGADWKFSDSWASNVTIVSAAFAGIIGADNVVKAITGSEQAGVAAVALVASVIAAGLVAAGPLILTAIGPSAKQLNAGGLLAASVATITGAGGQLGTLTWLGATLPVPGEVQGLIAAAGILGAALLALYAGRSMWWNLTKGGASPPPKDEAEAITAAKLVAAAVRSSGRQISKTITGGGAAQAETTDGKEAAAWRETLALIDSPYYLARATSPGDDQLRSAVL
jgi:hypothetical protein